jgi:hypothetical protein
VPAKISPKEKLEATKLSTIIANKVLRLASILLIVVFVGVLGLVTIPSVSAENWYNAPQYSITTPTSWLTNDVNGYNAWPNIAKLANGNLLAVYRASDWNSHGFEPSGRIVMKTSTDNGRTWSSETIVVNEAGVDETIIFYLFITFI